MRATSLLALFVSSFLCLASANAEIVVVDANKVGATQEGIGLENVNSMIRAMEAGKAKSPQYAKASMKAYVQEVIRPKLQSKSYEGVVDPHGVVRILDGHHRARAAVLLSAKYGIQINLTVHANKDFKADMDHSSGAIARKAVWAAYAKHLVVELRKGQFNRSTELIYPLTRGEFSHLGRVRTLGLVRDVPDSPLRSAIGQTMFQLQIDSSHFSDYVEFKIGRWIEKNRKHGKAVAKSILEHGAIHPETIKTISSALLTLEGHKYLGKKIRPQHERQARKVLKGIKRVSRAIVDSRAPEKQPASQGLAEGATKTAAHLFPKLTKPSKTRNRGLSGTTRVKGSQVEKHKARVKVRTRVR